MMRIASVGDELNNSDDPRPYCYSVTYVCERVLRGCLGAGNVTAVY